MYVYIYIYIFRISGSVKGFRERAANYKGYDKGLVQEPQYMRRKKICGILD